MPKKFEKGKHGFHKSKDYMENITYEEKGKPVMEEGKVADMISVKSLRSLPYSSYSVQADPYDASLPTSRPYPILNSFNKKVGGKYGGVRNIDGGNVQQYPNSLRSKMLKYFDYMKLNASLNMRYRPMKLNAVPSTVGPDAAYVGSGLIDQCRQSIAETTSVLQATTFTQMAIYNYVIETDLPMGTAVRTGKSFKETADGPASVHYLYTDLTDVIYASTTFYQLFIQECLNVVNNHNSYRLKMGTMIRTSWNRETPALNGLFGLFKKKSFLSLIDSICLAFPGEYVDVEWAKQVNNLTVMLSRRSDAFTDPCLELQARHVHPTKFNMYLVDGEGDIVVDENGVAIPVFSMERDLIKSVVVPGSGAQQVSFWQAVETLNQKLSAYETVAWARNHQDVNNSDNAYFNTVKVQFDVISLCLTTFKTLFNDVREVLDVVGRTGVNTWVKGFRPSVTKDTDAPLFDNQLINDIFKTVFSGANYLTYNNDTKRWRTDSLWNMYSGIPEYDAVSGGAFLSLSAKVIDTSSDEDETFKYLPILCYYDSSVIGSDISGTHIQCVARDGTIAAIKADEVQLGNDPVLSRLAPLDSQASVVFRIPHVYASDGSTLATDYTSTITKSMLSIFGVCAFKFSDIEHSVNMVDADVLAIYSVEIEDITNDAIAYARATGPFRGSIGYESKLGFNTFGQA